MQKAMKTKMDARKIHELRLLQPVLEKAQPSPAGKSIYERLAALVSKVKLAFTVSTSSFGEAEWRRLEYRNELSTRESERMNHFGIR